MNKDEEMINYLNNFENIDKIENEILNLELNNDKLKYEIENNENNIKQNTIKIIKELENIDENIMSYNINKNNFEEIKNNLIIELKSNKMIKENLSEYLKDLNKLQFLINDEYYWGAIIHKYNFDSFYNYLIKHKKILKIVYLNIIFINSLDYSITNINDILKIILNNNFETFIKEKSYYKLYEIFNILNLKDLFWENFNKYYLENKMIETNDIKNFNINNIEILIDKFKSSLIQIFDIYVNIDPDYIFYENHFIKILNKLLFIYFKSNKNIEYEKWNINYLNEIINTLKNKNYYRIIIKYILYPYFKYNKLLKYNNKIETFYKDYIWIKINLINSLNDDFNYILNNFTLLKNSIYKEENVIKVSNIFNSINIKKFLNNFKNNNQITLNENSEFNFNYFNDDILYDIDIFEKLLSWINEIMLLFNKLNEINEIEFNIIKTDDLVIEIINHKINKKFWSYNELNKKFKSKFDCFILNLEFILFEIMTVIIYIKFNDWLNKSDFNNDDLYQLNNEFNLFKIEFDSEIINEEINNLKILNIINFQLYDVNLNNEENDNNFIKFLLYSIKINLFYIFYLKGNKNINDFKDYIIN